MERLAMGHLLAVAAFHTEMEARLVVETLRRAQALEMEDLEVLGTKAVATEEMARLADFHQQVAAAAAAVTCVPAAAVEQVAQTILSELPAKAALPL
jgi:hypothetical protein